MTTTPPDPDVPDSAEASAASAAPGPAGQSGPAGEAASAAGTAPELPSLEPSLEPAGASADPVSLLVHAVGQLPADQRDLVLTWLLRQRPGLSRQWTLGVRASEHAAELRALQLSAAGQPGRGMPPTAQQVVPVRFPSQQHAQLREWCAEHGFSMATVIRGLVARFLDSQLPDRN